MSSSVIVFLISFVLGVFLTPTFRLIALRLAILDKPSNRKIQTEPVPYLGGIAVLLAVFLSLFAASKFESSWTRQHPEGWIILLVSLMVLLVGLIDDFVPVNYKFKLIFQVTTSLLLTFYLGTTSTRVSLVETDWINVCATALLLVFFMNAINFFDNWNGATAITIGSSSLFLGILMFNNSQNFLGSVSFAISGALMGFLPWNFPKAKIFLGDAGTLFIVFLLGVLAIRYNPTGSSNFISVFQIFATFFVPLADCSLVILFRILRKVNPATPGKDHLSHRLFLLGLDYSLIPLLFFLLNLASFTAALLITKALWFSICILFFLFVSLFKIYWRTANLSRRFPAL